ncbi:MAG: GTP-binding protein [Candidatus Thorarchaeota archaeon]|nr:MAG: GTP-binding protein [Candidatus Thorarchaeota archaeon]
MGSRKPLYMFKMVSLGDGTVGKTSCIMRYTEGSFGETYQATMGASLAIKNLEVETEEGKTASAQIVIWDLGGQPSFRELRLRYMAGASVAFIVYDVTAPVTFMNVYEWYRAFIGVNPEAVVAVVANKIDREDRVVPPQAGEMIEKWLKVTHIETSAKTGENVEDLFAYLIQKAVDRYRSDDRVV